MSGSMRQLAILASGAGSNMLAIQRSIARGLIRAKIALVLSNKPDAAVLSLARQEGLPTWGASHKDFDSRADFDAAMLAAMEKARIDTVILAGYMRLLSPFFIRAYEGRIINIHPSLLPAFAGNDGVGKALAHGVKIAGCTVHFVIEELDAGPVIVQAAVPVLSGETREALHARIQSLEHRIYPQAVQWLVSGRLERREQEVVLLPGPVGGIAPSVEGCLVWPPLEEGF